MQTRREFLGQVVKAVGAVVVGALGGAALALRPKPTYEMPEWTLVPSTRRSISILHPISAEPPTVEHIFNPDLIPNPSRELRAFLQSCNCPFEVKVRDWDCDFTAEAWDRPPGWGIANVDT